MIPWGGVKANGIEQLTRDNTGATAAYKIMHQKLVMWWAPLTPPPAAGIVSADNKRLHVSVGDNGEKERKRSRLL